MIPKTIHCCWFGGPKTQLAEKCQRSWQRFAPGWTVREWNAELAESLRGLPGYRFFKNALASRKWAMASDWLRMAVLYQEGGVYLDFDVELICPIDDLCAEGEWIASEWTVADSVWMNPGGGLALSAGSAVARTMLEAYERAGFDAQRDMMPFINEQMSAAIRSSDGALRVLPPEVMSPIDVRGVCHRTAATRGIHHYAMSWASPQRRIAKWLSWHGMRGLVQAALKLSRK